MCAPTISCRVPFATMNGKCATVAYRDDGVAYSQCKCVINSAATVRKQSAGRTNDVGSTKDSLPRTTTTRKNANKSEIRSWPPEATGGKLKLILKFETETSSLTLGTRLRTMTAGRVGGNVGGDRIVNWKISDSLSLSLFQFQLRLTTTTTPTPTSPMAAAPRINNALKWNKLSFETLAWDWRVTATAATWTRLFVLHSELGRLVCALILSLPSLGLGMGNKLLFSVCFSQIIFHQLC